MFCACCNWPEKFCFLFVVANLSDESRTERDGHNHPLLFHWVANNIVTYILDISLNVC